MINGESYKRIVAEAAKLAIGEENILERVFIVELLLDANNENQIAGAVGFSVRENKVFIIKCKSMMVACGCAVRHLGWQNIIDGVTALKGPAGFNPLDESGFGIGYVVWMLFTAGLVSCAVWQTADNVSVTLDYYDISIEDRLALLGPNTVTQAQADEMEAQGVANAQLLVDAESEGTIVTVPFDLSEGLEGAGRVALSTSISSGVWRVWLDGEIVPHRVSLPDVSRDAHGERGACAAGQRSRQ